MRTRNAGVPKTPTPPKKPPVTRKSAAKAAKSAATPPPTAELSTPELLTPSSSATPVAEPTSETAVEQEKASEDAVADPPTKRAAAPKKKVTRTKKVIKKVSRPKTPALAEARSAAASALDEAVDVKGDQDIKDDDIVDAKDEQSLNDDAVDVKGDKGIKDDDVVDAKDEQSLNDEVVDVKGDQGIKDDDIVDAKDEQSLNGDGVDVKGDEDIKDVDVVDAKDEQSLNDDAVDVKGDQGKKDDDVVDAKDEQSLNDDGVDVKGDQGKKDDDIVDAKDEQSLISEEISLKAMESEEQEELGTQMDEEIGDGHEKGKSKMDIDDTCIADAKSTAMTESPAIEVVAKSVEELSESPVGQEANCEEPIKEVIANAAEMLESEKEPEDQLDDMDDGQKMEKMDDKQQPEKMDDCHTEQSEGATQLKEDHAPVSEGVEDYGDEEGFVEPGEEDLRDDEEPEAADDMKSLNGENKEELAAAAKERKLKKEHEIFVGGLDREVVEEDVKKAFETVGEVVEVRLLKDPSTNKNRGFAFVRFATKDQAKKALMEMKNPAILGKQCGTAANEDNDTLFVGNICNTWTKEAINQKLKDYNVQGVENINLVQDPRHDGLSRGFCFIQFACHADAMFAYKRLQKPDAVFGHTERTVKVAFSEPLQEPDPEVMAKVKSVFVDGLPPFWDEDSVRKHFKSYGEIERVTLARNMASAKRKDFGFVDYLTHEAAIACIEDVNRKELVDGNSKIKVRARLSNPLPKMQAVKGGMRGGFPIGRPAGRSVGRPGPPINRPHFQNSRVSRGPFNDHVAPYVRRVPHRGGHGAPGASAVGRPNFGAPWHGIIERGPARPIPPPPHTDPFLLDSGGYPRPYMGRHYDDPYMHSDSNGLKRPYYMTQQDPTYMEPSRVRARYDYTNSGRGSHFRDTYGAGSSMHPSGYYGTDYGVRPPPPPYNVRDRSYGSGRGGGRGYY
ncbi:hypothetical protein RND81_13G213000 [Saponaria officinalis]|uniref:RRM domain-containing protein n=2 Tax=Saponaria officinalis TaxID=3572 RepID=A0AAW1H5H4_SAPOF